MHLLHRTVLICVLVWIAGCEARPTPKPVGRVILFAVDGADWKVLDPLIREGQLPNFARLKSEGASGKLTSLEPIFSPVLRATISTGLRPSAHGIESFTVDYQGERVPVTSNLVRVPRVWEILSRLGRSVGVIGWWTTWPADSVNGFLVSERTWPIVLGPEGWPVTSANAPQVNRRTFPEALYESIRPLIVTRHTLTERQREQVDVAGALATLGGEGPAVADIYAKDVSFLRLAEELYPQHRPDFFSLYFELPDAMSHYFWQHWRYSRWIRHGESTAFLKPPGATDSRFASQVGETFEQGYRFVDAALGQLLEFADEQTLVLVVSDHGYGEIADGRELRVGDSLTGSRPDWHVLDGVILAWGHGVAPGREIHGASVLDITPTVLYALGEPVGADMDGRVLTQLFDSSFATRRISEVPTHATASRPDPTPLPSPEDRRYLEQLRALGYVE